MSAIFEQISEALIDGMKDKVLKLVQQALDEGSAPKDIINNALLSGMSEVGVLFKDGELKATKVGATTKSNIIEWIKENI